MNAYGYYEKGKFKEGYKLVWPSSSLAGATENFAKWKGLSLQEFSSTYNVEKVDIHDLFRSKKEN